MAKCKVLVFLLLSSLSISSNAQQLDGYEQRVRDMVGFLEYFLNTVGDKETSIRDKDVIINESYNKIFRDAQVQIEDDLLADRQSVINKDVVAYLKDVDFFFKDASFDFDIIKVEQLKRENGEPFFRVELNRVLDAITIEGSPLKNSQKRYIEVNLDPAKEDLKIASMYTTKVSKDEELIAWWSELSYEWSKIFKVELNTNDEIDADLLYKIVAIDSLDLSGNQYIFNIEPLYVLTNLKYLNISDTRIADLGPLRSANTLETLVASQTEVFDLSYLKYLNSLKYLDVSNTRIRDITAIDQFSSLIDLNLAGNYVADFSPLASLRGLKNLNVSNTALLATLPLMNLDALVSLNLSNTLIGDLEGLKSKPLMKELNVSKTDVVDLTPLSTLTALEVLNINQTSVNTLQSLLNLKSLTRIYCDNTNVTGLEATNFMTKKPRVLVINNSEQVLQWWSQLNTSWKNGLRSYMEGQPNQPSKEQLVMLLNRDSLNLEKLRLSSIEPLRRFYKLRVLNISDNFIHDLDPINHLDKLEELYASSTTVKQLTALKELKNLKYLDLSKTKVSDIYILTYLADLKYLNVNDAEVSWDGVKEFHNERPDCDLIFDTDYFSNWWDNLTDDWKRIFRENNQGFSGTPDAFTLHKIIAKSEITIEGASISDLKPLWDFLSVKEIYIRSTLITDLNSLPALTNLEILECTQTPVENIGPLGSLSSLRRLDISNTAVDDLRPLATLSNLADLNCSGTNLSNLRGLEGLVSLTLLDCSNTRVSRLDQLYGLGHLKKLSCYNTRLNQRDISGFQNSNPDCKIIFY